MPYKTVFKFLLPLLLLTTACTEENADTDAATMPSQLPEVAQGIKATMTGVSDEPSTVSSTAAGSSSQTSAAADQIAVEQPLTEAEAEQALDYLVQQSSQETEQVPEPVTGLAALATGAFLLRRRRR
ncbi:MAG: PEP-CTERM sorting domain-containing protein [Leptolyngbya sp. SIO4C1]|nr:PEP-CTERM sorting domain-containing protein [Leptolyngbya sp. SIO4C1]